MIAEKLFNSGIKIMNGSFGLKKLTALFAAAALIVFAQSAFAQSSPNLRTGQVPTAAQWNSYFAAKQDNLGILPSNILTIPGVTIATSSGPFTIKNEQIFILNKSVGGNTTINLPAISTRRPSPQGDLAIYDWAGNAGSVTIVPNGTEYIMGANSPWVALSGGVAQSGTIITFKPIFPIGWVVQ
jgi:hypothetical protein